MEFSRPLLEVAGLIVSLALVGLILARADETAKVVTSTAGAFGGLIGAASMTSGAPVGFSRFR